MQRYLFAPLVLGLSGLALAGITSSPDAAWVSYTIVAATLVAHAPAILPVSLHGALLPGNLTYFRQYPEITAFVAILIVWTIGVAAIEFAPINFMSALILLCALASCYAAVRGISILSSKIRARVCHPSYFSQPNTASLASTAIFQFRLLVACVSAASLILLSQGNSLPYWLPAIPIVVTFFVAAIAGLAWKIEENASMEFSKIVWDVLARQLKKKPTSVAVYHAGTRPDQTDATIALCRELQETNQPYVLIVREKAALEALEALSPLHLWRAENLSSLSPCAQPTLTSVLYAHDTPKNSHFTRNSQYRHVLFLKQNEYAHAHVLPKNLALYTNIVAASEAHAHALTQTSSVDMASRVTTIESSFARPKGYTPARPRLSLHVAPQFDATKNPGSTLPKKALHDLIAAVKKDGRADLQIWFPPASIAATDPELRSLYHDQIKIDEATENRCSPQSQKTEPGASITLHIGSESESCAHADMLIAARENNLDGLLSTTLPIVWFDTKKCPPFLKRVESSEDSIGEILDAAFGRTANSSAALQQPKPQRTFRSLDELLATPLATPRTPEIKQ
ncbi:MAG: hypothetical protein GJ677_10220 [Rhodobacteraceae bacterium]|nr:hypothetical protein [Paracoccaceae bacterium]